MKMDFMFTDYCNNNVQEITQIQNNIYQLTDSFSYVTEALTQEDECQPDENDFIEFWKKNYQNYYKYNEGTITNTLNKQPLQPSFLTNNDGETKDFNELEKILDHVPRLPSYLQRIGGEKINFIMIATTLDHKTIIEDIGKALDQTEFQAFPLSFGQVQAPMNHNFEDQIAYNVQQFEEQENPRRVKRKHSEDEELQQNKKEMINSYKSGKKSRMSWMTKTSDLDEEDKELEQRIKMLIHTKQL